MSTFLTTFLLVTAGLLLCAIPVFVVARRRGRSKPIRNFAIGAVVLGMSAGFVDASSDRLIEQCIAAGNIQCVDYGGSGLMFLIFAGFLIVSLARASVLSRS